MQLTELNAISPIDGRYRNKTVSLSSFFSEEALIKYRVLVEVEYFIALCEADLPQLSEVNKTIFDDLRKIYTHFSTEDALWIKETEKTTNHDVKAVEYFIKTKFGGLGLEKFKEFIHFGLTSQDINNTAIPALFAIEATPSSLYQGTASGSKGGSKCVETTVTTSPLSLLNPTAPLTNWFKRSSSSCV